MKRFTLSALALCVLALCCTPAELPEGPAGPNGPGIVGDEPAGGEEEPAGGEDDGSSTQPEESMTIRITVGDKIFTADIEPSETGRAFLAKLPLTLGMSELNGNEKYCYGVPLPRADRHFGSISAGDLMLYSGNCVVLFYGPAGGYSYTRIGRLQSTEGLAAALGSGSVTVTFGR